MKNIYPPSNTLSPEQQELLTKTLNSFCEKFQFNQVEIGPLHTPITFEFYKKWIDQNFQASMTYLKNHSDLKETPQKINPRFQSVITLAQPYFPTPFPLANKPPARVALYAQNIDYHFWLKDKLNQIIDELKNLYPEHIFQPYVDSGPVLERNWGYENGLGWFGKNTCLIHPKKGSLFFIAEILTSLELNTNNQTQSSQPLADFCGQCQKCIEVCPTQALIEPRVLKSERCISFLTIESKSPPPIELREKLGDWFFGCDLCQTVCPWNFKIFKNHQALNQPTSSTQSKLDLTSNDEAELISYFRWLLTSSHKQIDKTIKNSPLARTGAKGLKRNALVVIGNRQLTQLRHEVESLNLTELEELKQWTLRKLLTDL